VSGLERPVVDEAFSEPHRVSASGQGQRFRIGERARPDSDRAEIHWRRSVGAYTQARTHDESHRLSDVRAGSGGDVGAGFRLPVYVKGEVGAVETEVRVVDDDVVPGVETGRRRGVTSLVGGRVVVLSDDEAGARHLEPPAGVTALIVGAKDYSVGRRRGCPHDPERGGERPQVESRDESGGKGLRAGVRKDARQFRRPAR
jgi:hypothetical protein